MLGGQKASAPAFDPTSLASFRSQYRGSAIQTDTAGINNYTVFGSPTTGTKNGLTTAIFNGTTDRLGLGTFSLGATALTVVMAAKVISNDATRREFFELGGICLATKNGKGCLLDGSELVGTTTIAGAWKRLGMTVDAVGNQVLYVNGVSDASQAGLAGAPASADSQVANYFNFTNIEIGRILVYKAVLSAPDYALVDGALSTEWAI